ncbi:MAG: hypothetical protein AABZ41_00950, partial [Bacteroidota bacterium]
LNDTFAQLSAELDMRMSRTVSTLPDAPRQELTNSKNEIQKQLRRLETGVRGLLSLYKIVHAKHSETPELETIKKEFETNVRQPVTEHPDALVLEQRLKERRGEV